MKSIFVIAILLHLQMAAFCDYSVDHSGEAFYGQFGLQNVQKAFQRQTVYTYPSPESDYNFDIMNQPCQNEIWSNYFVPMVNENSYIRPIKANCETEVIYQKEVMNQPDCYQSPSTISTSWAPLMKPVVIRPNQKSNAKIEVVKVEKSSLAEALKLANMLYRNERLPYAEPNSNNRKKPYEWKPTKHEEVMVSVNLDCKNDETEKTGVANQKTSKNAEKPIPTQAPEILPIKTEMDPHHLLKSGKIQLKETHLSEHDSIVEVIMDRVNSCNNQEVDQEPCDSKLNPQKTESCDGEETTSQPCLDGTDKDETRPIIKNRFVVLHLKDGERMIQDPLIKFLAKV